MYGSIEVWKVVGCTQRVFKFLLRIKHLPTAVYINGSDSVWYIRDANAKLYAKNKTRFAKTIFLIDRV